MPRWPWRRDKIQEFHQSHLTEVVKAQVVSLVGDLRKTLADLDDVLRATAEDVGHTGRTTPTDAPQEDPRDG